MLLTQEEIAYILELLREKHGSGYSEDVMIARLQGKLSIMLEAKSRAAETKRIVDEEL